MTQSRETKSQPRTIQRTVRRCTIRNHLVYRMFFGLHSRMKKVFGSSDLIEYSSPLNKRKTNGVFGPPLLCTAPPLHVGIFHASQQVLYCTVQAPSPTGVDSEPAQDGPIPSARNKKKTELHHSGKIAVSPFPSCL